MIGVYFSGCGNTKACIKKFLKEFDEEQQCFSIEDDNVIDEIRKDDIIIFAYPIYYSTLPKIVYDFIIRNKEHFIDKEIFIITTMALFSGDGTGCAGRLFEKLGASVVGGLMLTMPDCITDVKLLKKSEIENQTLWHKAEEKIVDAATKWKKGQPTKEGLSVGSHALGFLGQRLWFSHKTKEYSNKLCIHKDACIGCSKCATVCPMHNIKMESGKAVAQSSCTMCYRCINHCPQKAITLLGKEVKNQYLKEE